MEFQICGTSRKNPTLLTQHFNSRNFNSSNQVVNNIKQLFNIQPFLPKATQEKDTYSFNEQNRKQVDVPPCRVILKLSDPHSVRVITTKKTPQTINTFLPLNIASYRTHSQTIRPQTQSNQVIPARRKLTWLQEPLQLIAKSVTAHNRLQQRQSQIDRSERRKPKITIKEASQLPTDKFFGTEVKYGRQSTLRFLQL